MMIYNVQYSTQHRATLKKTRAQTQHLSELETARVVNDVRLLGTQNPGTEAYEWAAKLECLKG